jgi:uncharacterized membrane protein HdeD (DUF308 family)
MSMSQQTDSEMMSSARSYIAENRTWFITLGIILIILGVLAILFPFLTTIAVKVFLGWLFLIGGVVQIIHAFSAKQWGGFLWSLLIGLLYVIVGAWLAFFPLTGILALTILVAAMFVVEGILEIVMAFRMRPLQGWGWALFSGIVALAVGVLIFAGLPSSAVWAIGLLVGINMISSGWFFVFLPSAAARNP